VVGGFCILTAASINVAIPSGNLTTRSTSTPPTAVQINRRSCRTLTVRKGHGQSRDVQFLQTLYSLTQQGRLLLFFDFDSSLDNCAPFIVIVALAWTPALLAILTIVALAWTTALHAILVRGRGLATYLDAVAGPCGPTSAFRIARGHLHATRSAFCLQDCTWTPARHAIRLPLRGGSHLDRAGCLGRVPSLLLLWNHRSDQPMATQRIFSSVG